MGFNLSKGERFDLSKSSNDDWGTSSSNTGAKNATNNKKEGDKMMIFIIVLTILVIVLNASLWYRVIAPSSNPVGSVKNPNSVQPVQ